MFTEFVDRLQARDIHQHLDSIFTAWMFWRLLCFAMRLIGFMLLFCDIPGYVNFNIPNLFTFITQNTYTLVSLLIHTRGPFTHS